MIPVAVQQINTNLHLCKSRSHQQPIVDEEHNHIHSICLTPAVNGNNCNGSEGLLEPIFGGFFDDFENKNGLPVILLDHLKNLKA